MPEQCAVIDKKELTKGIDIMLIYELPYIWRKEVN